MAETQIQIFSTIRSQFRDQVEMVDQLVNLLNISRDSVYRRIKGGKPLSYDETILICSNYGISLDDLFYNGKNSIMFTGKFVEQQTFGLSQLLDEMIEQLTQLSRLEDAWLTYVSKDIPVFYYLMFPEVAAFKLFVWARSQMQFEDWKDKTFSFQFLTEGLKNLARKVATAYMNIPSIEILNVDNVLNDLRQLEYYWDTRTIAEKEDLLAIYSSLHLMVNHMEAQASLGSKFIPGLLPSGAKFQLYVNDFFIGDNTIFAGNTTVQKVFLNHAAINFMSTSNPQFVAYNGAFIRNLIRKSTLISEVGERTRSRFFHLIHDRINRSAKHALDAYK